MIHLEYANFSTTQSYTPNDTIAVSQFLHHKKLHSICYICSVPISAPHKDTLQMLNLQYPTFSTTQSYTPNVTLAVSQLLHHTKLHSKCYTCSIPISAPHKGTLQTLHLDYPNFEHHTKLHSRCYTCSIPISAPHKATLQMLHLQYPNFSTTQSYTPNLHLQYPNFSTTQSYTPDVTLVVSQFQHHTKLHSKYYTYSIPISAPHKATPNVTLPVSQFQPHTKLHSKYYTCNIPISAPLKATLQMLHLQYPNFSTTQSYTPNITLAVSQFQHHSKLHSKCYTSSIPILAPHKSTLEILHLQYPNFSTTQNYTPNITLAVSQFQHHSKLHSKCYTCNIPISAPHKATLHMLHLHYPNFTTTQSYTPNVTLQLSQFQHYTNYITYVRLVYSNFSTTQSYTRNVTLAVTQFQDHTKLHPKFTLAVTQFQHHTKLHSKCYT